MKVGLGMAVSGVMALVMGSANAQEREATSKHFFLNKNGGVVEERVNDPKDKRTREAVRQGLKQLVHDQSAMQSPAMRRHQKEITYRYEQTDRGGRIRITAKNREALLAVQDFLRLKMAEDRTPKAVTFTFIRDTSLVVVPVMVDDRGPYRFLLDTGASNSILSAIVADSLRIPAGRRDTLFSAGGNIDVTLRAIDRVQIGDARLERVEIAVANFSLLQTLRVDGILGGDYLRRFKVSIDYERQIVQIEPGPDSISLLVA